MYSISAYSICGEFLITGFTELDDATVEKDSSFLCSKSLI